MAKPKNLKEFLERQNPEELMYIGTEEGGGWLVIDTAANVIDILDEIDERLKKYHQERLAEYQCDIDRIPEELVKHQKELKKAEKRTDPEEIARCSRTLRNKEAKYVSAYNGRKKYQTSLQKWKFFKDRKIIDHHRNDPTREKDRGICVLIDGFEKGDYWFKEEYDEDKNK